SCPSGPPAAWPWRKATARARAPNSAPTTAKMPAPASRYKNRRIRSSIKNPRRVLTRAVALYCSRRAERGWSGRRRHVKIDSGAVSATTPGTMRLTLRSHILLTVLPLLLLMAVLGGAAVTLLYRLGGSIGTILRDNYDSVLFMERLNEALER